MWTDEYIFQVSYGNVGGKAIRKKDEANDPSCHNRGVSHLSSLKVWSFIAANKDANLYFCKEKDKCTRLYAHSYRESIVISAAIVG